MGRSVKAGIATLGLCAAGLVTNGCCHTRNWTWLTDPHACSETITQDPRDHYEYVERVEELNARGLNDDLDLIFMTERPTRLTRWTAR